MNPLAKAEACRTISPPSASVVSKAVSKMATRNTYTDGEYLDKNRLWDTDESWF
jgi:hypothetical protein